MAPIAQPAGLLLLQTTANFPPLSHAKSSNSKANGVPDTEGFPRPVRPQPDYECEAGRLPSHILEERDPLFSVLNSARGYKL